MRISKKIATAAAALALAAGLLAPTAAAACPYTVGPLGRVLPGADRAGAVWHWFRLHLIHPHGAPGTGPAGTVPGRHSFAAG